jgi:hypothetical protein
MSFQTAARSERTVSTLRVAHDTPKAQIPGAELRDGAALRPNIGWERQRLFTICVGSRRPTDYLRYLRDGTAG